MRDRNIFPLRSLHCVRFSRQKFHRFKLQCADLGAFALLDAGRCVTYKSTVGRAMALLLTLRGESAGNKGKGYILNPRNITRTVWSKRRSLEPWRW
jgi:hypothetical protein